MRIARCRTERCSVPDTVVGQSPDRPTNSTAGLLQAFCSARGNLSCGLWSGRETRPQRFVRDGLAIRPTSTLASMTVQCITLGLFIFLLPSLSRAFEPVRAEIGKETTWTGEAVPLIITLYSPGPFSGTAAFELPDLSQTVFVKTGNPMVGSEEIDDESYMTQRHEFTLYTQRSGEIVIPSFRVRFSGKKTFTSAPEPTEGATAELRFESKRPPGTESMGVVISATAIKSQQTWNPVPEGEIKAGDVIVRTITRNAEGTTAMMLPPISTDAPVGVQVYSGTQNVQDKVERGDATARRTDTIKYQFQRSGRFTLPELTFVWWDPKQEKLQSESVAGLEINVAATSVATQPMDEPQTGQSSFWMIAIIGLLVFVLVAWLTHKPVGRWIAAWRTHHNRPEAVATRKLRAACAANDASAAYAALMAWLSACRAAHGEQYMELLLETEEQRPLREQLQTLSRELFASESDARSWNGKQLSNAFSQARRQLFRKSRQSDPSALPALNP